MFSFQFMIISEAKPNSGSVHNLYV
jgi:hypothetical protein